MAKEEYTLIKKETWEHIMTMIAELRDEFSILKSKNPCSKNIYTNQDLRKILKVNDKLIRKYREDGLLEFSNVGNKFWYTNDNVKKFIANGRK